MMISDLVAPGANKFALDYSYNGSNIPTGTVKTIAGVNLSSATTINSVNISAGLNWAANGWNPNLSADRFSAAVAIQPFIETWTRVFNGQTAVSNIGVTNAVIVKSAGNDALDTSLEYFAAALANNLLIKDRLLIVGALNKNGTVASPATIASYSNTAGTTADIANRFVVANGNTPYSTGGVAMNSSNINAGVGTSYAAPVVAGYAAVVMQKFPNLSAANTSNIILDTARTDTITGYSAAIHGKGEASLSRALAPVGSLR
jgi:hypothetical protein